ncbi:uncharacterized protein At4g28440-like [Lolium rigidum]|uniref:uncharacterized protein At4g28440-like n=1 Tax=Lolium rigidum TaxID=89674 RepID=UPI001F5D938B|nr:uncharacterized protein At4g28440-like [Lolium rigidum]XP_047058250.1 uncharacterized protein At4g28440-like [Lolium rigidum]
MAMPPVFVKVDHIYPGTKGHTLLAKVLTSKTKTVRLKTCAGRAATQRRIECLIGDETGCILFNSPDDYVDVLKPGNTVILRNAKIDMSKGIMRLLLDKRGRVEVTEPASFDVKEDNNLSLVEYELVSVYE